MNILKKLTFVLAVMALLFTYVPTSQAQEDADSSGTVFLPLISAGGDGTVTSADKNTEREVVSRVFSAAEQNAALKFWTREEIAKSQPMVMISSVETLEPSEIQASEAEISGPYGFSPAGLAEADADLEAQQEFPLDWVEVEEAEEVNNGTINAAGADAIDGTPGTYSTYVVNKNRKLWKLYPHRWVGRVSFRTPNGTSNCSGTAISGNVMLTAAHCLYDTTNNRWYTNVTFAPAYRSGKAPYGVFPATTCWVLTAWFNLSGNYSISTWARHDVGVCEMGKSKGRTLNQRVGWMGREWNYPYERHVHNLGYPFRDYRDRLIPNAGKFLTTCIAETYRYATETRGMGCNWSRGNSGGPWMAGYAVDTVRGHASGVYSGFFINSQNAYGARFNSNNIVPLCNSAGC